MPALQFPLPVGESQQRYAPASLAREILNMRLSPEGVLESVRGPTALIPDYGSGYPLTGRMHGVFHAVLDNGTRDCTLIRSGSGLYAQTGWTRGVETLQTGLSDDPHARFPDQFVEIAGKVVWNNGVDAALIYDGYTLLPLGYDRAPSQPTATGPSDTGHPVFRNYGGYSHPGQIGTQGNFFTVNGGALLAGMWQYAVQFEDAFGNRSPLSPVSGPVILRQETSTTYYWSNYENYPGTASQGDLGLLSVQLDDLPRQLLVTGISRGPAGTVARILYRSSDQGRGVAPMRFLARIPDNATTVFPDDVPDGMLGAEAVDYMILPRFSVMCAHKGSLVIMDGRNLRISDAGFPGSFRADRYVPIGSNGADPTALFSHNGRLYAATASAVYLVEDGQFGLEAKAISESHGVVGPEAVTSTPFGVVGLGMDGYWILRDGADSVEPISEDVLGALRRMQPAALSRVVSKWSPLDREMLSAVPYAGIVGNGRMLTWDGVSWKERQYGISVAAMCVTRDWRRYTLIAGKRVAAEENVWVLQGETQAYAPPTKTYRYRSAWLSADPTKRLRADVRTVFVGIVETSSADVTWTLWQNGSRDTAVSTGSFEAVNPATADLLDTLVLGTGKLRHPRLTWKKFDARIRSCESFAFDLECQEPTYMSLAAFAFEFNEGDVDGARPSRQ